MSDWETVEGPGRILGLGRWVRCVAHIRQNETGEVRKRDVSEILDDRDDYPSTYGLTEGNYSCDCNRAGLFNGIEGISDAPCSVGRYSVNLENPVTGEIFYREF